MWLHARSAWVFRASALLGAMLCSGVASAQVSTVDVEEIAQRLRQQRSLYQGLEYKMTQERRRTSQGMAYLLQKLPPEQVLKKDEPDAVEKKGFHRIAAGEKRYLKRTDYRDEGPSLLGTFIYKWNGNTGSRYCPEAEQGCLSLEPLESGTEDIMESMFIALEGRDLCDWLEDPQSRANAYHEEGLVHVRFDITHAVKAEYVLDPQKGMMPSKYTIYDERGELLKEGRVVAFVELAVVGGSLFFPEEYESTFWVDPGFTPQSAASTADKQRQLPHIPITKTHCVVEEITPNPVVDESLFEPQFPDGTEIYDEVVGHFVTHGATAPISPRLSALEIWPGNTTNADYGLVLGAIACMPPQEGQALLRIEAKNNTDNLAYLGVEIHAQSARPRGEVVMPRVFPLRPSEQSTLELPFPFPSHNGVNTCNITVRKTQDSKLLKERGVFFVPPEAPLIGQWVADIRVSRDGELTLIAVERKK